MKDIANKKYKTELKILNERDKGLITILNLDENPSLKQLSIDNYILENSSSERKSNIYSINYKAVDLINEFNTKLYENYFNIKNRKTKNFLHGVSHSNLKENLSYAIISIISQLMTSIKDNNGVKRTKLIMMLNKYIMECYTLLLVKTEREYIYYEAMNIIKNKTNYNTEEINHELTEVMKKKEHILDSRINFIQDEFANFKETDKIALGEYILHTLESLNFNNSTDCSEHKFFKISENYEDGIKKRYYSLTDHAMDLLSVIPKIKNTHPLISKPSKYKSTENNCKLYNANRVFISKMYHLNDNTGIREQNTTISKDAVDNINYLQSTAFKVNKKYLHNIELNIVDYFKEYSDNNIEYITYESEADLISRNDGKSIQELYAIGALYRKSKIKFKSFVETLFLATIYKDHKLYFNVYLDYRGRFYYESYLLSPMMSKTLRKLIKLDSNEETQEYDITASGLQIMGLLCGNRKVLELTRFLETNEKIDIYEYIKREIKANISGTELSIYSNILTRKFVKNIVMCLVYSESNFSRSKKIIKDYYTVNNIDGRFQKSDFNKSMMLAKKIVEIVFSLFPDLKRLYDFILDKVYKPIYLKNKTSSEIQFVKLEIDSKHIKTVLIYPMQEEKKFKTYNINNNRYSSVNLKVNITPIKPNHRKLLNALIPNYIHMFDSAILSRIIKKCFDNNIKIYTIHDCIGTTTSNKDKVNKFYYEACIEIMNSNPLNHLVELNINDLTDGKAINKDLEYFNDKFKSLNLEENYNKIELNYEIFKED